MQSTFMRRKFFFYRFGCGFALTVLAAVSLRGPTLVAQSAVAHSIVPSTYLLGVEDVSLQTSFVVDDFALNVQ